MMKSLMIWACYGENFEAGFRIFRGDFCSFVGGFVLFLAAEEGEPVFAVSEGVLKTLGVDAEDHALWESGGADDLRGGE